MDLRKRKIPTILYEDTLPGEEQNPIPYIEVGKDEESYPVLFISEYRETGEFEIDPEHGSSPVVEMDIHAYVNMNTLKEKLTPDILDQVRVAIGMQPLQQAQQAGQKIIDNVNKNAELHKQVLQDENSDKRLQRTFALGEDFRKKANLFLEQEKSTETEEEEK